MATWPATLPTFQEFIWDDFENVLPNNVIRTEMEIGPAKVRMRGSSAPELYQGRFKANSTKKATFKTFFKTTISYGATQFDIVHPYTGAAAVSRIVGQPKITSAGKDYFITALYEILP